MSKSNKLQRSFSSLVSIGRFKISQIDCHSIISKSIKDLLGKILLVKGVLKDILSLLAFNLSKVSHNLSFLFFAINLYL